MKKDRHIEGNYFYGNKISDYGLKNKRVDYAALANSINCVRCGRLMEIYPDYDDYWELENGYREYYEDCDLNEYTYSEMEVRVRELENELEELEAEYEEDDENEEYLTRRSVIEENIDSLKEIHYKEYWDYFIIDANGADTLKYWTNEYVIYNEELDLYVWGVDHFGTSWEYVCTEIECIPSEEQEEL